MIKQYAPNAEPETFTGYIDKIWQDYITHSDENVRPAEKPKKKG